MTDIVVPAELWSDGGEAALATWFYADGDQVSEGAIIAEVMVEKATIEILAPADGVLSILLPAEQPVAKEQVIGRIL
jgi:pyruvate/2-oxoglutarate dehydrogenase complex dihydrolipoamide acyltransferase (E2) component